MTEGPSKLLSAPIAWTRFGTPALFLILLVILAVAGTRADLNAYLLRGILLVLAVLGVVVSRFVLQLADQVVDAGDHLIIRRRGQEWLVPWDRVVSVDESHNRLAEFITLHIGPNPPGPSLTFCPPFRWSWFPAFPSPVAAHIRERALASYRTWTPAKIDLSTVEDA